MFDIINFSGVSKYLNLALLGGSVDWKKFRLFLNLLLRLLAFSKGNLTFQIHDMG